MVNIKKLLIILLQIGELVQRESFLQKQLENSLGRVWKSLLMMDIFNDLKHLRKCLG